LPVVGGTKLKTTSRPGAVVSTLPVAPLKKQLVTGESW
jgi:hypothetical protein